MGNNLDIYTIFIQIIQYAYGYVSTFLINLRKTSNVTDYTGMPVTVSVLTVLLFCPGNFSAT